jgi:hypothetical protein
MRGLIGFIHVTVLEGKDKMRTLLAFVVLLTGCAHQSQSGVMRVIAADYRSPRIERCLSYWATYNAEDYTLHPTNHFYVGATEIRRGELIAALVYWKEERTILFYEGLNDWMPLEGQEVMAWRGGGLKLGRDTVDTIEDIGGSSYLQPHRQWVDWMDQCISKGKLYVIALDEATKMCPNTSTKP